MAAVDDELVIASGQLILRPVIEEDAYPLANIYADPMVRSALGKDKPPPTQHDLRASIGAIRAIWGAMTAPRPCMMFAIINDGLVIGVTEVVFGQSDEGALVGELMIVLAHDARRQGTGAIVLDSFISWSFQRFPDLREVWGTCVPDNEASIALMTRVGMEDCGVCPTNEGGQVHKFRSLSLDHSSIL
jgi:RimJ/RimL family protein N-acetyltransferase